MKTRDLLNADERLLAGQLKTMKLKELERHAENLLGRAGQADYPAVLREAIKAVPQLNSGGQTPYQVMQALVRSQLPQAPKDGANCEDGDREHRIQRIAVLLMVIIKKKFEKIHNS